jgi:hypothetical protein
MGEDYEIPPPMGLYVLDASGEKAVPCHDVLEWARWYAKSRERWVARSFLDEERILVSTIFLGLDHNYMGGPPILWETMVFRVKEDGEMYGPLDSDRCTGTREQAIAMHEAMKERAETMLAKLIPAKPWQ